MFGKIITAIRRAYTLPPQTNGLPKRYICTKCPKPKVFKTKGRYKNHMEKKHGQQ